MIKLEVKVRDSEKKRLKYFGVLDAMCHQLFVASSGSEKIIEFSTTHASNLSLQFLYSQNQCEPRKLDYQLQIKLACKPVKITQSGK